MTLVARIRFLLDAFRIGFLLKALGIRFLDRLGIRFLIRLDIRIDRVGFLRIAHNISPFRLNFVSLDPGIFAVTYASLTLNGQPSTYRKNVG